MPSRPGTGPLVVVGSGAAGLMAAATAAEFTRPLLLTDRGLGTSNSAVAQGGLQLPQASPAALDRFARDIVASARTKLDPERLRKYVEGVRPTIEALRSWGLELDTSVDGGLLRKVAGGLSEPRIVTAGDQIGAVLIRVLRNHVLEKGVEVRTRSQVTDIEITHSGLCLLIADRDPIEAGAVIAATGGVAFDRAKRDGVPTSNPSNRNSLLTDALRRRGLPETDPGLFQYQPFGLVGTPDPQGQCVPESVVGYAVRLLDRRGREICPPGADRLAVTEAMFNAIDAGAAIEAPNGDKGFRLTLSDIGPDILEHEFPKLYRFLSRHDLVGQDVLVRPFLHYQLGGFTIGPNCSTSIPGLYLAGEMTGGLHGRNRLMGNGITDSLVHGRCAALEACVYLGLLERPSE